MIGTTLNFIAKELNDFVCQRLKIHPSTKKVLLSSIVAPDGSISTKESNVLLLKLVNIEEDPIAKNSEPTIQSPTGSGIITSAPLYINLKIVLAAYFKPDQIQVGMDVLTMGLAYLQGKSLWNPQNTPDLPAGLERLLFEMDTLDMHQLSHLWGAIGAKYMPSTVYKLRMLIIDDHDIVEEVPLINTITASIDKS